MTSAEMKDAARKAMAENLWSFDSPAEEEHVAGQWAAFASSCIQAERKEFLRRLRAEAVRNKDEKDYAEMLVWSRINKLAAELESEWSAESNFGGDDERSTT